MKSRELLHGPAPAGETSTEPRPVALDRWSPPPISLRDGPPKEEEGKTSSRHEFHRTPFSLGANHLLILRSRTAEPFCTRDSSQWGELFERILTNQLQL